jgi:transcriptional regulator with XRE-family HTH domain
VTKVEQVVLRLRNERELAGVTQVGLAAHSGIGVKSLSTWETGWRAERIRLADALKLADSLGVKLSDVLREIGA